MPRAGATAPALLIAASLLVLPDGAAGQPSGTAPPHPLSLLDVPYLSQSEALCGGAAAAMVLRYWGAAGVTAEDFAALVDRSRAGITTAALTAAVRERGYDARPVAGSGDVVSREMAAGRPAIALIEDRPGAFHYVVVVGWHPRAVVLHDPARTPYVVMRPEEFGRRWEASGNWMLLVAPAGPAPVGREGGRGLDAGAAVERAGTCDALVREGVRLAGQSDLAAAERSLADAAYRCGDAASYRELAGVRALQRRWTEAADLAGRAVERDARDLHAWRILATARYITGDARGALDAWNHAGEPRVDLVSIAGLVRTSHRVVERYLDVERGEVLSSTDLARAGRRLDEFPAAALARVEFVPRGSGLAELRGHVVERSVVPRGRITWAALGLRTAIQRELLLPVASLGHGGERLDASWRFWPGRPRVGVALHAPWRASIVSLQVASERQPFAGTEPLPPPAQQLTASGAIAGWATSWLRWEGRGGMARWQEEGSFGTAGAAARVAAGRTYVAAGVDAWMGGGSFARGILDAGWRSSAERRGLVLDLRGGVQAVARRAPLDLWPAGDTGHVRTSLLRAHPALDGGRLRLERLGRVLLHASGEVQQWWRAGAVPVGASVFADVGRTAGRMSGAPPIADVDAGGGVRVALPAGAGVLRADVAHGFRDGRNAFSIGWAP